MPSSLLTEVSNARRIAGIGPALKEKLARLGLRTDDDLVLHFPLRYEDETYITPLAEAQPGVAAQFEVEVISTEIAFRPRRQLISRVRDVAESSSELMLRFLNFYPSQQKMLAQGARLRVYGEVRRGFFGDEIVHPRCTPVRDGIPLPASLTPVYPTTAGLGQGILRRHIEAALARTELIDTLPRALVVQQELLEFSIAVDLLHHPPPALSVDAIQRVTRLAWQRVRFDELVAQQISMRRAYAARRTCGAPLISSDGRLTNALLKQLPFTLTAAQQRVWREIAADLAQPHPMQRLLQGDVGSGKTIVAALAMLQTVEAGYQSALMAPTEILAEQHYRKLAAWMEPLGQRIAWLSGSQKKRERTTLTAALANREIMMAVGTHALLEDDVSFSRFGLAIVDEQHRFGVHQRLALKRKGEAPHQLTMSATPIPRTLAMTFYADLDVSVIDALPPGRTPVTTRLAAETRRAEVIARVRDNCLAGRQAYWVCPLIEESETLQLKTAEETYAQLLADLPGLRIGLVHGRLKPAEKAAVMASFVRNEVQVLVATTVIEVGVDVPNASVMVIENAERFGLAQLHQLRGRVGRGAAESACVLLYGGALSETARQRLKIIYENSDGFEIARQDLALRGPGEFIGARQSGVPLLRYANLDDTELVERARDAAELLLRDHPELAERHLQRWLGGREDLLKA
jgi:ATP-dependent DNA helicase RecG